MEEAAKLIERLAKDILPPQAHYLSLSATRRYPPRPDRPDDKRLEEQDIRPLQYTTFVSEADRGLLLTRAYFEVREDPTNPSNAITNSTPRIDPNKVKKVSLKDYKNRKTEGESPPKSGPQASSLPSLKEKEAPKKLADPVAKEMDIRRDAKKGTPSARPDAHRQRSPSPERKRRIVDSEENSRPVKRSKVENSTPNAKSSRPSKDATPQKTGRPAPQDRPTIKDSKPLPATNGRLGMSNTANRGVSPRPSSQVNGSQKSTPSNNSSQRKGEKESNPSSKKVPELLSPLDVDVSDLLSEDTRPNRPSPKKKPADTSSSKPPPKKLRDDHEPSPSPKKRKVIPPLLSPTLPAVVMEELARVEKIASSKESSQRSSQVSDSPGSVKKAAKPSKRDEAIHVDNKEEERTSYVVTMKYKKRTAKTIERLLNLPPGGKKKAESVRREDRATRDRSDSLEPGTARKRPHTASDVIEPSKRPRTSDSLRPSTPPKQSAAMTRVASSSSQAGTPGMANSLTPASQAPPERKRPVLDSEKLQRIQKLQSRVKGFTQLGTKLKHERDAVMNPKHGGDKERPAPSGSDREVALGAGIQSLLSYMQAFKLQGDIAELERQKSPTQPWKELLALFRAIRTDCSKHNQLTALLLRIQGICIVYLGRALCTHPLDPAVAKDALANSREQFEVWKQSENVRRSLGVYDGRSESTDGGPVGKLLDRLGPWSTAEEAIPITIEVLRKVIRINGTWKPAEDLSRVGQSMTNGVST